MSDYCAELETQLEERETGIADLLATYEAAEVSYFAAVAATTPVLRQFIASNSSEWVSNAGPRSTSASVSLPDPATWPVEYTEGWPHLSVTPEQPSDEPG